MIRSLILWALPRSWSHIKSYSLEMAFTLIRQELIEPCWNRTRLQALHTSQKIAYGKSEEKEEDFNQNLIFSSKLGLSHPIKRFKCPQKCCQTSWKKRQAPNKCSTVSKALKHKHHLPGLHTPLFWRASQVKILCWKHNQPKHLIFKGSLPFQSLGTHQQYTQTECFWTREL